MLREEGSNFILKTAPISKKYNRRASAVFFYPKVSFCPALCGDTTPPKKQFYGLRLFDFSLGDLAFTAWAGRPRNDSSASGRSPLSPE